MCTDLITASGLRSLRTLPSTRVDMNGSSIAIRPMRGQLVDRPRARCQRGRPCRDRRDRCGTTSFRRSSAPRRWPRRWPRSSGRRVRTARPASPPRFIDENTTLSSSAPSSSRSSRMSEVASTPSTPGSASAARNRSSRSVRLFIAVGRDPTARAPRAGWSAATIISRPLPRTVGRMVRVCHARSTRLRIRRPQVGDLGVVLAHGVRH